MATIAAAYVASFFFKEGEIMDATSSQMLGKVFEKPVMRIPTGRATAH